MRDYILTDTIAQLGEILVTYFYSIHLWFILIEAEGLEVMIKILECSVSELNKSGAKNKTKGQGQKIQFISGFVAYNRRTKAKKRGVGKE